jgi:hypothetical protein
MNNIRVYSIQTYEKQILRDYYCQIMTHEFLMTFFCGLGHNMSLSNPNSNHNPYA